MTKQKYRVECESLDGRNHTIKSSTKEYNFASYNKVIVRGEEILWFAGFSTDRLKAEKKRDEACSHKSVELKEIIVVKALRTKL